MVLKLRNDRNVRIVPQTPEQFESALRRYKQAADMSWSLTDCASFQVMEAEQIQAALTHDQHFAQAGFWGLLGCGELSPGSGRNPSIKTTPRGLRGPLTDRLAVTRCRGDRCQLLSA